MTAKTIERVTVPPVSPEELPALEIKPGQDILMLLGEEIPADRWIHGDDLCDCVFQRIATWTNPYLARTMRVRLCCLWAELAKDYPQFVQEIPAYYDENDGLWREDPMDWNGEQDMPKALWFRQLAVKHGMSLEMIRGLYEGKETPKGSSPKASADDRANWKRLIDIARA